MWVKNWHAIAFPWGTSHQCNSRLWETGPDTQHVMVHNLMNVKKITKNDEHASYFPPHLICCLQTIGSQLKTQIPSPATTESSCCLVTVQVWGPRWNHRMYTSCGKRKNFQGSDLKIAAMLEAYITLLGHYWEDDVEWEIRGVEIRQGF